MSRKAWLMLLALVATLGLDQGSKAVVRLLEVGARHEWIPGFFTLVHLENPGGVLGFAAAWPLALKLAIFLAAAAGMVVIAGMWLARTESSAIVVPVALGTLLGGAAGNSFDRVVFGRVTDFLMVGEAVVEPLLPWLPLIDHAPAFNLADGFLGLGIVALAASVGWRWIRGTPEEA